LEVVLRSNKVFSIPSLRSLFDGKERRGFPAEAREEARFTIGVTGFMGLVLFAIPADWGMRQAAGEPPRNGQGPRPAAGPSTANPARTDSNAEPQPPRPASAPVLKAAIHAFRSECMKCHESDGSGEATRTIYPKIPDFRDPKWHDSRSDLELSRSIAEGKGKSMRPMKDVLKSHELTEMVSLIRGFRGGKQIVPEAPSDPPAGNGSTEPPATAAPKAADHAQVTRASLKVQSGSRLFQQFCVKCHGADGTAKELRSRSLAIPNFTDPAWHGKRSDQQCAASILDGKGTRMPAFRGIISDKDAQDLVACVRAMCPNRPQSVEVAPTEFDNHFRELQQQFGKLQKELRSLSSVSEN
jgi:mono/diheme cytochrome c family protein